MEEEEDYLLAFHYRLCSVSLSDRFDDHYVTRWVSPTRIVRSESTDHQSLRSLSALWSLSEMRDARAANTSHRERETERDNNRRCGAVSEC